MKIIPEIIHQIFFGSEESIPEDYRRYRDTWRKNHPHWEYRSWNAEEARRIIEKNYAWFLPVYDGYSFNIQRCDAVRYFILHRHGGLYVDMDMESLKPVDELFKDCELALFKLLHGFTNAAMASAPGHPLWPILFSEMEKRRKRPRFSLSQWSKRKMPTYVCNSTGPMMLTDCIRRERIDQASGVCVYPGYFFEPLAPREIDGKLIQINDTSNSYAIHHMSTHWTPLCDKFARFFFKKGAAIYWMIKRMNTKKRTVPSPPSNTPHADKG